MNIKPASAPASALRHGEVKKSERKTENFGKKVRLSDKREKECLYLLMLCTCLH